MNGVAIRVLGVTAIVIVVASVGLAAARAAQPPDASQIPVVQTSRPLSKPGTDTLDSTLGSVDLAPAAIQAQPEPLPTEVGVSGQAPSSGSGSGSGSESGSGSGSGSAASSSERSGNIVVPPVRDKDDDGDDDEHDHHDKPKSD
jgi:hypothetical protein